jgi:hypothetical protein
LRIYVPATSLTAYKTATNWSTYESRIYAISGGGTETNPWIITEENQLRQVGRGITPGWTLDAHYRLEENINLINGPWTTIGTYVDLNNSTPFTGSFDGNNKTITGLNINAPTKDGQGMFACINETGVVKNLALVDCTISGAGVVGGIVGGSLGTVKNCYVTGNISGTNSIGGDDCVGGVVGYNLGLVENCYTTCQVNGFKDVGGVVGSNVGTVKNCYSTGNVTGNDFNVGGVVGGNVYFMQLDGIVENCYATGTVSGANNVGGVVGLHGGDKVINCVGLNKQITITGQDSFDYYGRVVGKKNYPSTNNYGWNNMTMTGDGRNDINNSDFDDGTNMTTANATSLSWWNTNNPAWNFDGIWNQPTGNILPTLRSMPTGLQNPMVQ